MQSPIRGNSRGIPDVAVDMEFEPDSARVLRDEQRHDFELVLDGIVAGYAPYSRIDDKTIVIPHVQVDAHLRGRGLGAVFADGLLADVRSRGEQVVPTCGWLAAHIQGDPQHHDLLAAGPA